MSIHGQVVPPCTPTLSYSSDTGLPYIWLTWVLHGKGLTTLVGVCHEESHADFCRKEAPRYMPGVIRAWNERREADHIFGASMGKEQMALAEMVEPRKRKKVP